MNTDEAGATINLLRRASDALIDVGKNSIVVKTSLDKPYPDDARWSPWTKFMEKPAARAYNLGVEIRRYLATPTTPDTAVSRVRALHSEHKIYDECVHAHRADDPGVRDIEGVGLTCEDGYQYSICRECCTHGSGWQSERCATGNHELPCWPCRTIRVLDGEVGSALM